MGGWWTLSLNWQQFCPFLQTYSQFASFSEFTTNLPLSSNVLLSVHHLLKMSNLVLEKNDMGTGLAPQVILYLHTYSGGYIYRHIYYKWSFQESSDLKKLKKEIQFIPHFTWAGALSALVLGTFPTLFDMDNRVWLNNQNTHIILLNTFFVSVKFNEEKKTILDE